MSSANSAIDRLARLVVGNSVADRRRWIGPAIAALGTGLVIWLAMPHVPWYVKLPVALFALLYVGAQSAAYLAQRNDDESDESGSK